MAEYDEEGMAIAAAKILLSLRNRTLRRWPEWVPRPSKEPVTAGAAALQRPSEEPAAAETKVELPQGWPKRFRRRAQERPKAATAWPLGMENLLARMTYGAVAGSGAPCVGEDVARSVPPPPRVTEKPEVMAARSAPGTPVLHCDVAAGPGPSTSAKARGEVAARKDATEEASSPGTPLDYTAAAESGAFSGGEDGAPGSPEKRKASGDEACGSPAKRAREDAAAAAGDQATTAADKVEEPKKTGSDYRDENGCLLFDLNDDPPCEDG